MKRGRLIVGVAGVLVVGLGWLWLAGSDDGTDRTSTETTIEANEALASTPAAQPEASTSQNGAVSDVSVEPLQYPLDEADSLWVIVNKERPIALSYVPSGLRTPDVVLRESGMLLRDEAATALERLFAAAQADGINLVLGSAYRSAELQATIYNNYVASYGEAEASRFSARPGTSEHQIGLAADVSGADYVCYLETCFGDTPQGQWTAKNAHRFGFVIRYPSGKEAITGYQYEPWHLRYVGNDLAAEVFAANLTLEEYFGL